MQHVDDRLALSEMCRVLRPDGKIVIMVPIVEGWTESYENPDIQSEADRDLHFGQDDHVRHYGGEDFRKRVKSHDLALDEFTAGGEDSVRYNLMRGEKVFLATK
jgi:SAM-dependent methyltransferase